MCYNNINSKNKCKKKAFKGDNMKNFLSKILKFILVISFVLLVFGITLRNTALSTISIGITKEDITENILDAAIDIFPEIDKTMQDKIKSKINSSIEIQNIANIYLDTLLYDIENNTVSNIDLSKDITSLLNKYLNELPSSYREVIISRVNHINYNKSYLKLLDYVKSKTTTEVKQFLDIFNIYTSKTFLSFLFLLLLISIILIIKLSTPIIEVLYNLGITLLISGGIMIVLLFVLKRFVSYITAMSYGSSISNPLTLLTTMGFGSLIIGLIMFDIYERYLDKDIKTNAKKSH